MFTVVNTMRKYRELPVAKKIDRLGSVSEALFTITATGAFALRVYLKEQAAHHTQFNEYRDTLYVQIGIGTIVVIGQLYRAELSRFITRLNNMLSTATTAALLADFCINEFSIPARIVFKSGVALMAGGIANVFFKLKTLPIVLHEHSHKFILKSTRNNASGIRKKIESLFAIAGFANAVNMLIDSIRLCLLFLPELEKKYKAIVTIIVAVAEISYDYFKNHHPNVEEFYLQLKTFAVYFGVSLKAILILVNFFEVLATGNFPYDLSGNIYYRIFGIAGSLLFAFVETARVVPTPSMPLLNDIPLLTKEERAAADHVSSTQIDEVDPETAASPPLSLCQRLLFWCQKRPPVTRKSSSVFVAPSPNTSERSHLCCRTQ